MEARDTEGVAERSLRLQGNRGEGGKQEVQCPLDAVVTAVRSVMPSHSVMVWLLADAAGGTHVGFFPMLVHCTHCDLSNEWLT